MLEFFVIIFALTVILRGILWNKERIRRKEILQNQLIKEQIEKAELEKIKQQIEQRRKIEELSYETIKVIYESKNDDGKPIAIAKRSDETYASIERSENRFQISEKIRIAKEKTNQWIWYGEAKYQEELAKKQKIDKTRKQIIEIKTKHLNDLGINYLFHMTHKDNLQNILHHGLKSHNYARTSHLIKIDIADGQVNERRVRAEPIQNRSIHDYVPLYFNPKNPMLFRRKDVQNDIIILAIDRELLHQSSTIFTNGNAAAQATVFYKNIKDLDKLNWGCINASYWTDFDDGKRIRCSEILVYPDIPTNKIQQIFCNNKITKQFVTEQLNGYPDINVKLNMNLYF